MTDIVERLRTEPYGVNFPLMNEAAAKIERLRGMRAIDASVIRHWEEADTKSAVEIERLLDVCKDKTTLLKDAYAEIERLRAALQFYGYDGEWNSCEVEADGGEIARRALEPKP